MPFISVSDGVAKKSFTDVENKFITKYLPVLEPVAVKVYLYALYLCQSGISAYTLSDLAHSLNLSDSEAEGYFEYLEEFELLSITSRNPFEVKILGAGYLTGAPKKSKPENYSDFAKSVQKIISGRMISTYEFREYFTLLEERRFEPNALEMIINYCVNMHGDKIRYSYIKEVISSFENANITTARLVEEKLSSFTAATPFILKILKQAGIKRQPYIEDERFYKKWTKELGFEEDAIIAAAKLFKIKNFDKLDECLDDLHKNRTMSVEQIEEYCNSRKESDDKAVSEILAACGLKRKVAPSDRLALNKWREWNFSDEMILEAAKLSSGKDNPIGYMNSVLAGWRTDGVDSPEKVARNSTATTAAGNRNATARDLRSEIEKHYAELRHAAEDRAEKELAIAMADEDYAELRNELDDLSIKLAFAEVRDRTEADLLSVKIAELESRADARLKEIKIDKADFVPRYHCTLCNDTGYDAAGNPCKCLQNFVKNFKN